jgi:predicted ATPase
MAAASGAFVLRARGVESEADVGFSALNQMAWKLLAYLPELDHAAREALEVALGLDAGAPPDLPLVSTAMLMFLCQARATTPLLIVVDDLPCVDRLSAEVLSFVARRVPGSRIGFLGAARPGDDGFFDRSGLPEHALGPLPRAAAEQLIASRFPGLAAEVRARVLAEAGGNPLALLELPAALSDDQRTAAAVLPAALPLTGRLREAFAPRIAGLPAPARRLLLAAALDR